MDSDQIRLGLLSFDPATAYLAATMYKFDDYKPISIRRPAMARPWKKIAPWYSANSFHACDSRGSQ
jgi:hypothetical protein